MGCLYVSFGMTKSASTFAWQLIKQIAQSAGIPVATLTDKSKGRKTWEDYIDLLSETNLQLIAEDIGDAPVVIKTHGVVTPPIIRRVATGEALAFASYRDLRDIALSLLDHGARSRMNGVPDFASLYTIEDTLPLLATQVQRFTDWVKFARPLLVPYDEICFDTRTTITRIAERLDVPVDVEEVFGLVESSKRSIRHFNKGELRRFEREMHPDTGSAIMREFHDFYAEFFPEAMLQEGASATDRRPKPSADTATEARRAVQRPGTKGSPIFIMSFDRPEYLGRVLSSLQNQRGVDLDARKIVLCQDGAVNPHSGNRHARDEAIADCIACAAAMFPQATILASDRNLGVAWNFDRAERVAFEQMIAPAAIFLEDDLVLGEHYIATLDLLLEKFADDERVGYVAAYGDHRIPLAEQHRKRAKLILQEHNWGFAVYRRQWLRMRRHILQYLECVRGIDYRDRDRAAIKKLYAAWGFGCPAVSQDAAKTIACCVHNVVKINTYVCGGRYIGEHGLHMNSHLFVERGYHKTEIYPEKVDEFQSLDAALYQELLRRQRAWAGRPEGVEAAERERPRSAGGQARQPGIGKGEAIAIAQKIFGQDVYAGYEARLSEDLQGWNSSHPIFRELVKSHDIRIIFDVGVWKGGSTITFAELLREHDIDGAVIAIDTFLGNPEHWNRRRPDRVFESLRMIHGFPQLYWQFLSNIKHRRCESYVVPLPQTSDNAARILRAHGIVANLVHLDSSNEHDAVLREARCYWDLLTPGGFLIGDDYHPTWPGVVRAADEFAAEVGLRLQIHKPKWVVHKPPAR
jgi:hypothetical protein